VKPTVGFTLPRVGDAEAAGCGATRLLELMNEERNGRDVTAVLVAAQNFPNRRVAPHPIFFLPTGSPKPAGGFGFRIFFSLRFFSLRDF